MTDNERCLLVDKIMKIAKREIRIDYHISDEKLKCGQSKIGGKPDTPAYFEWPYFLGTECLSGEEKNRPLSFLMQIDLKDVAEYDTEGLLPHTGTLSFFYELCTMKWGFDPLDLGSAKVFYFPDSEALYETAFPQDLEEDFVLPEFAVDLSEHISLPDYYEAGFDGKTTWDDYDECISDVGYDLDEMGDRTKLLGYADIVQNPMQEECEAVSRGYRVGCSEDYAIISEEEKKNIEMSADKWMLLFQMGTIEKEGYELMFGDCGHIYFWIKKSDLLDRKFDNVRLILQCS